LGTADSSAARAGINAVNAAPAKASVRPLKDPRIRSTLSRRSGHGNAGDFQPNGTQRRVGREVQRLPIIATERDVRGLRLAVHDRAELLAGGIDDVDTAGAACVDIAERVDFEAVGTAGFRTFEIDKHALALVREQAVGRDIERVNLHAARIADIENLLIG